MALVKCPECQGQVSTAAKTCPSCGAPVPQGLGRGRTAAIVIVGVVILSAMSQSHTSAPIDNRSTGMAALVTPQPTPPPELPSPSCKTDWHLCVDNADLINNYERVGFAKYDCRQAADGLSKYGTPEWPFWVKFGYFRTGTTAPKTGQIQLTEDEAKFSNGFGAMQKVTVVCDYDLTARKVKNVTVTPR
jgi:hypothetical protein